MKGVFIDIETTGLDFDIHEALEVAIVIVDLNNYSEQFAYTSCIKCDECTWSRADEKALAYNGFTRHENQVHSKDIFEVGKDLEEFFIKHEIVKGRAVFICQNPSFDRPFFLQLMSQERMIDLKLPYHWLDLASMFWIKYYGSCFPIPSLDMPIKDLNYEISLSKDSIAAHFGIAPEQRPHRALNGVMHLIKCYMAVCGISFNQRPCF